jgi:SpoVK/Ycf46/Vps4 family AAA+-type ATPase
MAADDPLESHLIPAALREALRLSPENAPLLVHVADHVIRLGGFAEAELLYKRALAVSPGDLPARLGLATAFFHLDKLGAALVVVEDLTRSEEAPANACLLHARLALKAGEIRLAAKLYQRARSATPPAVDAHLEEELAGHLPKHPSAPRPADNPDNIFNPDSLQEDASAEERERLPAGDWPTSAEGEVEKPAVRFDDVGGMDRVKEEIRMKIILPLKQPELFKAYGKQAGGGILLYGPPGCGKTFLARATAGEVDAGFLSVGINDVLDMWIGQSEKNLHALFEQARAHRPCVLFFDEVDALGANRTDMAKSGGRHLINQFLSELDGVQASNDGVLILAATNAPWHLDNAFRRPGRFDRILFVPPPDTPARASIIRLLLRGKPVEGADAEAVAKKTEGFSGADLKALVELAVDGCLREAMRTGKIRPVGTRDLLEAAKQHRPTTKDWFETARNYALYANQSGLYDDVLAFLKIKK